MSLLFFPFISGLGIRLCYLFVTQKHSNTSNINIYNELPLIDLFFPQMRPEVKINTEEAELTDSSSKK